MVKKSRNKMATKNAQNAGTTLCVGKSVWVVGNEQRPDAETGQATVTAMHDNDLVDVKFVGT